MLEEVFVPIVYEAGNELYINPEIQYILMHGQNKLNDAKIELKKLIKIEIEEKTKLRPIGIIQTCYLFK